MTTATFGVEFALTDRTIRGLAIPYGVRASDRPVLFEPGSVTVDQNTVLRAMHSEQQLPLAKLGAGMVLDDRADGLYLEAELPDTQLGRDTLELVRSGVLGGLSAELAYQASNTRAGVQHVTRAALHGVAVVSAPAFTEARLFELTDQRADDVARLLWH